MDVVIVAVASGVLMAFINVVIGVAELEQESKHYE